MLKSEPILLDREKGTIVHVFNRWVKNDPGRIALKEKRDGSWVDIHWGEFGDRVEKIAFALKALNIEKGDKVVIFSENRVEWTYADMAILATGAVTVPLYASSSADQTRYIVNHSEARIIFVNSKEQAAKVTEVRGEIPSLEKMIIFNADEKDDSCDYTLEEFYELGGQEKAKRSESLDDLVKEVSLDDISTIMYTSGTTSRPKGCILGHDNIMFVCQSIAHILPFRDDDLIFSFLPLAHALERHGGQFISIYMGLPTAYGQGNETVAEDMREVKPTITRVVPRFFEKTFNEVQANVQKQSTVRKDIFDWALKIGKRHINHIQKKKKIPASLVLQKKMADTLVYSKVKSRMGGRLRFIICGGAPLAKKMAEFFASLDILIMEGYGLTECTVVASINREDDFHFGTVGIPIPGCEIKIASDGEIMIRHGGVFRGYYKDEEATKAVLDEDGWLYTGDIGYLDKNNCIVITDRKKDLIITAGGKNITPQFIENKLSAHPLVSNVMVYGDQKPYLVALITIDEKELKEQADHFDIKLSEKVSISEHEGIYREVRDYVDELNVKLSPPEQIRKFRILDSDFLQEKGEITPNMKVKRNIVRKRYKDLIEGMYED